MSDDESKFIPPEEIEKSGQRPVEVELGQEDEGVEETSAETAESNPPSVEKKESKELIEKMEKWCEWVVQYCKEGNIPYGWDCKSRWGDGKWTKDQVDKRVVGGMSDYESGGKGTPHAFRNYYKFSKSRPMAACTIYPEQIVTERYVQEFRSKRVSRELPRTRWQKIFGKEPETEVVEIQEPYQVRRLDYRLKTYEGGQIYGISFYYIMNNYTGADGRSNASAEYTIGNLPISIAKKLVDILKESPDLFFDIIKKISDLGKELRSCHSTGAKNFLELSPPLLYASREIYNGKDPRLQINVIKPVEDGEDNFDHLERGLLDDVQDLPLSRRHLLEE